MITSLIFLVYAPTALKNFLSSDYLLYPNDFTKDVMLRSYQIEHLQHIGFRIALDDYGSGFSNLHQVKKFSFSNIKLDMNIVWDYIRDRDSLLPAMVQAFKTMGFSVTAEGIETAEMRDYLLRFKIKSLQGYYYSKPLPVKEFLDKYVNA